MHHRVNTAEGPLQPVGVADIADESANARVIAEFLTELILLEFIAGEHSDPHRVEFSESMTNEGLAERTGATGHQN